MTAENRVDHAANAAILMARDRYARNTGGEPWERLPVATRLRLESDAALDLKVAAPHLRRLFEESRTATAVHTVWVLQAYLAPSSSHPRWFDVTFGAVDGYERYRWFVDNRSCYDPRLTAGTGWTFVSAAAATEVLGELVARPQPYWLRVVERRTTRDERPIAGYDIVDGTAVPRPDGTAPSFMGERVAGCVASAPTLRWSSTWSK